MTVKTCDLPCGNFREQNHQISLFLNKLYFRIVLHFQKSCKDNMDSYYIPHTQFPIVRSLMSYICHS